ncbi:MAG: hypothetical protein GIW95_07795 [Candidatus Eremiobacteraeota bacterium]|nr:hypothetical protein [Candidatus Eremiobacteraeota bacterium]
MELPRLSDAFKAYLENPPADSAARRATEFGIDLTLTYGNMYGKTPSQRLAKLDAQIAAATQHRALKMKRSPN